MDRSLFYYILILLLILTFSGNCIRPELVKQQETPLNPVIDDFEDQDKENNFFGDWNTETDSYFKGDSSISIQFVKGHKSRFAIQFNYYLGPVYNYRYVLLKSSFNPGLDASAYKGIRFFLKGNGKPVRLDICSGNISDYDFHGIVFKNTSLDWQEYQVAFADLFQEGWGVNKEFNEKDICGLQFKPSSQVSGEEGFFIIDDLEFITELSGRTKEYKNNLSKNDNSIRLDQVGYFPDETKTVFLLKKCSQVLVKRKIDDSVVLIAPVSLRSITIDQSSGQIIYQADFSSLSQPGKYYIETDNNDRSFSFEIRENVYDKVFLEAIRFYYYQRCGLDLEKKYAGHYARRAGNISDKRCLYLESMKRSGFRDCLGGWYDASDYGRYVVNAGISVGTLIDIFELFQDKKLFIDNQLNIPESGNKIPDLLDEIRVEIEWLLKMQDDDGSVFHKVTGKNFAGFVMPDQDTTEHYIMPVSSCAAADFTAMTAMAARIFKKSDPLFALKCLQASLKTWEWLENHPGIVPEGGWRNPPDVGTGDYFDYDDQDERLWAAAELFKTTDNEIFHDYFKSHYQLYTVYNYYGMDDASLDNRTEWYTLSIFSFFSYIMNSSKKVDPGLQKELKELIIQTADSLLARIKADGYGTPMLKTDYIWGSNSILLNYALVLCYAHHCTSDRKYMDGVFSIIHYIFGRNGTGYSFVTGYGEKSTHNPHHRVSAADGLSLPVPGMLAGGPNYRRQDSALLNNFPGGIANSLVYADDPSSFSGNEVAINWNAPLVFVLGYLQAYKKQYEVRFDPDWLDFVMPPQTETAIAYGKREVSILKRNEEIIIDGIIDKQWQSADKMPLTGMLDNKPQIVAGSIQGADDSSGEVCLLWDEENIYILANITDNNPVLNDKKNNDLWNGDALELYFNTDSTKIPPVGYSPYDFQVVLSIKGEMWIFGQNKTGVRDQAPVKSGIAVKKSGKGYVIEAKLHAVNFNTDRFYSGMAIGIDCALNDDDNGKGRKSQIFWNGNAENFQNSKDWGRGYFK